MAPTVAPLACSNVAIIVALSCSVWVSKAKARRQAELNDPNTPPSVKAFIRANPDEDVPYQLYTQDEANATKREIAQMKAMYDAEQAANKLQHAKSQLEVQQARLELAQALGQLKLDTAATEKSQKAAAIAAGRAKVRDLALGLFEDPNLDAIVGPFAVVRLTYCRPRWTWPLVFSS